MVTGAITHSAAGNATRSTADAVLNASVELLNGGAASATAAVVATVFDSTGSRIGTATASSGSIPAGQPTASTVAVPPIPLPKATLWSVEDPALYVVQVEVKSSAGELLDALNTTIGIHKIEFDADQGFLLNSRRTKILGACNHQDFGGLGVAVPDALQEHRVERMKSFGINAWRTLPSRLHSSKSASNDRADRHRSQPANAGASGRDGQAWSAGVGREPQGGQVCGGGDPCSPRPQPPLGDHLVRHRS